jgi:hypothetical protein
MLKVLARERISKGRGFRGTIAEILLVSKTKASEHCCTRAVGGKSLSRQLQCRKEVFDRGRLRAAFVVAFVAPGFEGPGYLEGSMRLNELVSGG